MANVQAGYGHGDVVGVPFDFYAGSTVVTGGTITMQTAILVVNPPGAVTLTFNLPLNPVDGAWAEISNPVGSAGTITATVSANTGDSVVGTAVSGASMTAGTTYKFRYTLNGFQPASGAAVNPRSWVRVQ